MDYSLNQKLSLKNKMITFHFFFSLFFSMLKITEIRELQYTISPICVEQKRNFIENWNRMENTPQTMNLQLNINETTYNVTQLSRRHWFKVLRVSFHENAPQLRLKTSSESLVSVYNFALTELTHTHTLVYTSAVLTNGFIMMWKYFCTEVILPTVEFDFGVQIMISTSEDDWWKTFWVVHFILQQWWATAIKPPVMVLSISDNKVQEFETFHFLLVDIVKWFYFFGAQNLFQFIFKAVTF